MRITWKSGAMRRQSFQARQLALGLLAHLVGQVGLGQPAAQLFDFRLFRGGFAQLVLDGLHLLAQQVLALLLAHLALRLGGDLLAQLQHLHLVRQVAVDQPQRLQAACWPPAAPAPSARPG